MTTTHQRAGSDPTTYTVVCRLDQVEREGGIMALVGGAAVAVFRTYGDEVFALDNYDPYSRASVLARGIVGTRGEIDFVASPMPKQAFDLRTGHCLDDAAVWVATYDVQVSDGGLVLVGGMRSNS